MFRSRPLQTTLTTSGSAAVAAEEQDGELDGVQKTTLQVTLYKPYTTEESLRRPRTGRHSQNWHPQTVLSRPTEACQERNTCLQASKVALLSA
jgi:hypothetical protein